MRCAVALVPILFATSAHADPAASASAGVGAGFAGTLPVSAFEVRGDLAWDDGALGLGARLRSKGDRLATDDWDGADDWLALLRYAVITRAHVSAAAGTLGDVGLGDRTLVDGFTTASIVDLRATGVDVRAHDGDTSAELVIGDVVRGTLISAAARARTGPVITGGAIAIDPAPAMEPALFAISANSSIERGPGALTFDVGAQKSGVGAALIATAHRRDEPATLDGRVELDAGTRGYLAGPFGPLYLPLRRQLLEEARMHELGGVGAAASGSLAVDDLGDMMLAARKRPGLPTELDAKVAFPARDGVQAAASLAWMPRGDTMVVGGEARVELTRGMWSDLQVARQYDDAALVAPRPVWQVTAWFGWTRSTD
jgi:hypothetical protein